MIYTPHRILVGLIARRGMINRRVGEVNINMDLKEMSEGWIHVAQDREQWRVLVNTVMDIRVREKVGVFRDKLSDCQLLKKDCNAWRWEAAGSADESGCQTQRCGGVSSEK
jgi:hypothetical protein